MLARGRAMSHCSDAAGAAVEALFSGVVSSSVQWLSSAKGSRRKVQGGAWRAVQVAALRPDVNRCKKRSEEVTKAPEKLARSTSTPSTRRCALTIRPPRSMLLRTGIVQRALFCRRLGEGVTRLFRVTPAPAEHLFVRAARGAEPSHVFAPGRLASTSSRSRTPRNSPKKAKGPTNSAPATPEGVADALALVNAFVTRSDKTQIERRLLGDFARDPADRWSILRNVSLDALTRVLPRTVASDIRQAVVYVYGLRDGMGGDASSVQVSLRMNTLVEPLQVNLVSLDGSG